MKSDKKMNIKIERYGPKYCGLFTDPLYCLEFVEINSLAKIFTPRVGYEFQKCKGVELGERQKYHWCSRRKITRATKKTSIEALSCGQCRGLRVCFVLFARLFYSLLITYPAPLV